MGYSSNALDHRASSTAHAETASAVVDAAATDLVALSHDIHSEPELAFHEVRSALKTQRLLAERGFEIVTGQGGMDTAFRATYGHGPLVIGVCAEYDALPGIGHACGHNIIAASAVGTGLGLAEVADAPDSPWWSSVHRPRNSAAVRHFYSRRAPLTMSRLR